MKIPFREYHLLQLLNLWEKTHYPLDLYISFYFKDNKALGSKDRQEISELAYALIRWRLLLDHLSQNSSWESRLQTYKKHYPFKMDTTLPPHIAVSFPYELFEKMSQSYGLEKAKELALISNTKAPTYIRVNPLKTTRDDLLKKWEDKYDVSACEYSPLGIIFHQKIHFFSIPEFKLGLFEIQDEASQLVSDQIAANKGDLVLDYCAGSGGKTLGFAHKLEGKGQIFLHDVRKHALMEAKLRLKRAGIQNAQIVEDDEENTLKKLKKKMDWVLVDSPCSGSGTLRRNPDMKWRFKEEEFVKLLGLQRQIFEKALSFVKPNGKIVFATCSILMDENERQVEHFIKTYNLTLLGPAFKTLPTMGGMDGFYAAVLQKE